MTLLVLFVVVMLFIFLIIFNLFHWFCIYAFFKGSPYVPTSTKWCHKILKEARLKKGRLLIELGSGDGRFLREARQLYGVSCVGLEINPLLIFYAKILIKLQNITNISYIRTDFFSYNLSSADYVYLYLLPNTIKKLKDKLLDECKPGTIIISHRFKVALPNNMLIKIVEVNGSKTYYYKLKFKAKT